MIFISSDNVNKIRIISDIEEQKSITSISASLEGENNEFFWRVRGSDGNINSNWSIKERFYLNRINEAPSKSNLIFPLSSIINANDSFIWEKSIDPDPNEKISYRFEVSNNQEFTELVLQKVLHSNKTSISEFDDEFKLENGNTYYWRVLPIDEHNKIGEYSQIGNFTLETTEIKIVSDYVCSVYIKGNYGYNGKYVGETPVTLRDYKSNDIFVNFLCDGFQKNRVYSEVFLNETNTIESELFFGFEISEFKVEKTSYPQSTYIWFNKTDSEYFYSSFGDKIIVYNEDLSVYNNLIATNDFFLGDDIVYSNNEHRIKGNTYLETLYMTSSPSISKNNSTYYISSKEGEIIKFDTSEENVFGEIILKFDNKCITNIFDINNDGKDELLVYTKNNILVYEIDSIKLLSVIKLKNSYFNDVFTIDADNILFTTINDDVYKLSFEQTKLSKQSILKLKEIAFFMNRDIIESGDIDLIKRELESISVTEELFKQLARKTLLHFKENS